MKTILLIFLTSICTHVYAQPVEALKPGSTKFSPISEKIKKLPSAGSLAKMKPSTGFILSPARMTANNNFSLHFRKPDLVTALEAEFSVNDESTLHAPTFVINFPANMGGTYVFELNIALYPSVSDFFNFKISGVGVTQVITIPNSTHGGAAYSDNKLVFAVTIPNSTAWVKIFTSTAPWKFRNVEITPMK